MTKTHRWKAIIGAALVTSGLALISSPGTEVRAAVTIQQLGNDIDGEAAGDSAGGSVAMSADGTRIAIGARFNAGGGSRRGHVRVYTWNGSTWTQTGADIDGEADTDYFGTSVAMSSDGTRIAIGARGNAGGGFVRGHVRVYTWNGTAWTQTGADIEGEANSDNSGYAVAMSSDGTRIAIGAPINAGGGSQRGHVRVYTWNGSTWTQTGADIDGNADTEKSGSSVAMSSDGTRIAVGAPGGGGVARVYTWDGTAWTQTGADIVGEGLQDQSGTSVALSSDGTRIAVGAKLNAGGGSARGHVRVYTLNGSTWTQTGGDIDGEADGDESGTSVALSSDGTRIAIGAPYNDGTGPGAGHVRLYSFTNGTWTQIGSDIDGEADGDESGTSVALSSDGTRIAIGAIKNTSSTGHVRVYGEPTVPAAPTISSIITGNGTLTVFFTPGADGGSPITNYKYSTDGTTYTALDPATTTSPFTISGLTNGTTYSVSIKAVNSAGDSPASTALRATPVAPEATPTTVAASTPTTVAASTPTTKAPAAKVAAAKPAKKAESLPETGNNSGTAVALGVMLAAAGLAIMSRRRFNQ